MHYDETSFGWADDFPKGYGHTSVAYLKRCFGYEEAKNGNTHAAQDVVKQCVKKNRLDAFREEYADSFILPVTSSKNALPEALASEIGLKLWNKVSRVDNVQRKQLPAILRLQHKPVFDGHVEKNMKYVIVDDVITQGGTISELRKYVLSCGGRVVAVMALAYSIGSHYIAPTRDKHIRLFLRFGASVFWMQEVGLITSYEELTNSQARYLLRFSSAGNVCKRLAKANDTIRSTQVPEIATSSMK